MGDIKLFRVGDVSATELTGQSASIERIIQTMVERHCDELMGVRFLASEYATGKTHGGRIDTLGIDENDAPVIIEYKRTVNENVINQGLFYLDWLLDHRAEFEAVAQKRLGADSGAVIDWSSPRLICVAADFTKYDTHAVQLISRTISLIRYKLFGDDLLMLEVVNAVSAAVAPPSDRPRLRLTSFDDSPTVLDRLGRADEQTAGWYQAIEDFCMSLGDDVQKRVQKKYVAFTRLRNFACIRIRPQIGKVLINLRLDPTAVTLVPGFSRDVRGHSPIGDVEVTVDSAADLSIALQLIRQSYDAG